MGLVETDFVEFKRILSDANSVELLQLEKWLQKEICLSNTALKEGFENE